jgi:predicted secreted protein
MINLKVGETFSLELISNPSTGYSWTFSPLKSNVFKVTEITVDADSKAIGNQLTSIFKIKGIKKGTEEIAFFYHRAWEKDVKPALTKTMTITIK